MILDTCFVIDVMRNDLQAVKRTKELIAKGEPLIVTSPTVFELFSGITQSMDSPTEQHKILSVLAGLLIWQLDNEAAQKAGEIDGQLIKSHLAIDPIDSMIAGIALAKGETVLTRNEKHFNRVPGLKTEKY